MLLVAPGMLRSEGPGDEPRWCDDIGCPCVIPKQLRDFRQGTTLVFVCPSSRISATLRPLSRGWLILGGHYTGSLR